MNLYTLSKELTDLSEQENPDITQFEALQGEFDDKIENIVKYIHNLDAMAKVAGEEAYRITEISFGYLQQSSKLKKYLDTILQSQGISKLDLQTCKLSYRKSSSVEIKDESQIPDSFWKVKEMKSIDKVALKEAINAVGQVPGAVIVEKQNLQIK